MCVCVVGGVGGLSLEASNKLCVGISTMNKGASLLFIFLGLIMPGE